MISKTTQTFFLLIGGIFYLAHNEAWKSNYRTKMSAVIYKGSTIYSVGHNAKTSCSHGYHDLQSSHAEAAAIAACKSSRQGLKMMVYRFSRESDKLTSSCPCPLCVERIKKAGIKQVLCVDPNMKLVKIKM